MSLRDLIYIIFFFIDQDVVQAVPDGERVFPDETFSYEVGVGEGVAALCYTPDGHL